MPPSIIAYRAEPYDYQPQFGVPVHEIGHALGFWHEQQRQDRDDWVRVIEDNINFYQSQFWKMATEDHGVPYDYTSVMHYPWTVGACSTSMHLAR